NSEFQQILDDIKENTTASTTQSTNETPLGNEYKTNMFGVGANESGEIVINRGETADNPMGSSGTWSVFVYMCGSDLESEDGSASADIKEILSVDYPENVNIIIETGGTNYWNNRSISAKKIQRFDTHDQKLTLVDEKSLSNMGSAETFRDFLEWGVENYPAANMGVILWNHGGGPVDGICFDELYDYDSLTLSEMNSALSRVSENMTDKFEFIGFDACLMASVEVASMLVPYADYMIASEQSEPGSGWDYNGIGAYLAENPDCNGEQLGKVICDTYFEKCSQGYYDEDITMSLTDLSKIDDLLIKFNSAANRLAETIDVPSDFNAISKAADSTVFFGAKSYYDGYTNLIDMGCFMENASGILGSTANECIKAIDNAVIYCKNGSLLSRAKGLSFFYPIKIEDSYTLRCFESICFSPSYIKFVEAAAYGGATGSLDDFSSQLGNILDNIWNYFTDDYDDYNDYSDYESSGSDIWNSYDDYYDDNYGESLYYTDSSTIQMSVQPHLDEDNCYSFTIAEDSLDYVNGIYFDLYLLDEYGDLIYLGMDNNLNIDWDTGVVTDNFYGTWIALDDGQFLTAVVIDDNNYDYTVFSSPILYNGQRASLRYSYFYDESCFVFDGVYLQNEENDAFSRMITLSEGDVIVPIYSVIYADDTEEEIYGDEYVYSDYSCIYDTDLNPATYLFSFTITDVFFNDFYTDYIGYDLEEDGELYVNDAFMDYAE
ncbi:MAG: clostripain-related cysteine peptidase, partial [Ruminiclostridium sp.]